MATIVKQNPIIIKGSNPPNDVECLTCMAVESSTKLFLVNMIWIYSNTKHLTREAFMPSDHLQKTLSETLNYFPVLAGRIHEDPKGNAIIHLTNEGILYTEAECMTQPLEYFITMQDDEFDYEHINQSDLIVRANNDWTGPPMSIQVTRLQCNSVILGISIFHCLVDPQSMSHFINTWASGKPPKEMPMFDKSFILYSDEQKRREIASMSRPNDCVFNRNLQPLLGSPIIEAEQQQRVIAKVYVFSAAELKNMKEEALKDILKPADFISTYDVLYAHMILVIAAATQTSLTDNIKVLLSFNGRSSFVSSCSPAVRNYFGSFPFWLYSVIPSDREPTLSSLAQQIHETYAVQTEHTLRDYNAYLMSDDGNIRKNQADADMINRDFYSSSWRKVHLLDANFGSSGFPIYSGPSDQLYPRYFAMMDSFRKDGSINILLGLRERDYERMIEQNMLHKYR